MPPIIKKHIIETRRMENAEESTGKKEGSKKCQICEGWGDMSQFMGISHCEHIFCVSCLHKYILYKVETGERVECPQNNCHRVLEENSILYSQLPPKMQHKFQKVKRQMGSPSIRACGNEKCEGFLQRVNVRGSQVRCEACSQVFCSHCFLKLHEGECDAQQLAFFKHILIRFRDCRKCNTIVEKPQNSKQMTCPCGYKFCYLCGEQWGHEHQCNLLKGQTSCCKCFGKVILLCALILVLPLYYTVLVFMLFIKLFIALFVGIVGGSCIYYSREQPPLWKILLAILFLPIGYFLLVAYLFHLLFIQTKDPIWSFFSAPS